MLYCLFVVGYLFFIFFFFNDTATTEIYTLSLHDALPISAVGVGGGDGADQVLLGHRLVDHPTDPLAAALGREGEPRPADRKSTRLNSSHANISYAVFCLKKKKHTPVQT